MVASSTLCVSRHETLGSRSNFKGCFPSADKDIHDKVVTIDGVQARVFIAPATFLVGALQTSAVISAQLRATLDAVEPLVPEQLKEVLAEVNMFLEQGKFTEDWQLQYALTL